jgi:hypothetical protein
MRGAMSPFPRMSSWCGTYFSTGCVFMASLSCTSRHFDSAVALVAMSLVSDQSILTRSVTENMSASFCLMPPFIIL